MGVIATTILGFLVCYVSLFLFSLVWVGSPGGAPSLGGGALFGALPPGVGAALGVLGLLPLLPAGRLLAPRLWGGVLSPPLGCGGAAASFVNNWLKFLLTSRRVFAFNKSDIIPNSVCYRSDPEYPILASRIADCLTSPAGPDYPGG